VVAGGCWLLIGGDVFGEVGDCGEGFNGGGGVSRI
jgi:hypothetical protein